MLCRQVHHSARIEVLPDFYFLGLLLEYLLKIQYPTPRFPEPQTVLLSGLQTVLSFSRESSNFAAQRECDSLKIFWLSR